MSRSSRIQALQQALTQRILVLDGAMGTAIQSKNLTEADFGGPEQDGCNEYLVLTRPHVISEIHEAHLAAGADIIETNTFGGVPFVLDEFGLGSKCHEINFTAAVLARKAADAASTPERMRWVAGSIGPTTKAISVTGGISFSDLQKHFYAQTKALAEGGVDYFLFETCQDTRNIKAGLLAVQQLFNETGEFIPVAVSGTIEPMGTMLAGQTVEALYASLAHLDLLYLGLNCATGPEFMTDHIRTLSQMSKFPIACIPNAGLPDENGTYLESPAMMCRVLSGFIDSKWINLIGGCCGTRAEHTKAFAELANGKQPRIVVHDSGSMLSGIEFLEITDEMRPVIVGERTNVIGSRKFKELIVAGKFEEAAEIGRAQVKSGAQIIDVCLANPDRDELSDIQTFLGFLIQKIKAPIMIDSTDANVIREALTYCQGKAIINSINLEDGEERFEQVLPYAKAFGAAVVVGTIDDDPDQGMGVTRERKLAIAQRSYHLLVNKYQIAPEDIYWDPLVFPCGTGDANYVGSAIETIEGIRLLKKTFPGTKTVLGISNISFGLPNAGREVLNSVFLYHCVQAGLDLAIVNSQKLERYASISENDREISENLLFNKGDDPVAAFAANFRVKRVVAKTSSVNIPLDQRLANYIIEGSKDGLTADIDLKLKEAKPLAIINGPLMAGMDEVGRLFNANKLIVAEVLQSAEAMKAAVAHLEPMMEKNESSNRGKVLLATVKGDVHDIGKNLVEIILSNNGFQVINLGIKVPPEKLIEAVGAHKPDIIGLSGLLVKSAQQMVLTASDFSKAGIQTPIMVGGAALTSNFVDKQIAKAYSSGTVTYAPDAMQGLELAKAIVNPASFQVLKDTLDKRRQLMKSDADNAPKVEIRVSEERSPEVPVLNKVPQVEDFDRHVLKNATPIEVIWSYINPMMLYGRHLGMKNTAVKLLSNAKSTSGRNEIEKADPKALHTWDMVEEVKAEYGKTEAFRTSGIYQFFKVNSKGNSVFVKHSGDSTQVTEFRFPRQDKKPGLCLADYVHPQSDTLGIFVVSVGAQIREISEELKNKGAYLKSHIIQILALESAEGYAEYIHAQMRRMLGVADAPHMTMLDRFQAKYVGKRYSFGYPACPRLDDQQLLFQLLKPEDVGIQLTDGFMMEPEASVSALVFHHPNAGYFSAGKGALS